MGQGNQVPPHIDLLAEVTSLQHSFGICHAAADIAKKAASHLERKSRGKAAADRVGTNVFIGHGRAAAWREKDFVQDRLGLPWDEFNRVPVAGITNISRLSEKLDASAIALLVMTAEDEMADGGIPPALDLRVVSGFVEGYDKRLGPQTHAMLVRFHSVHRRTTLSVVAARAETTEVTLECSPVPLRYLTKSILRHFQSSSGNSNDKKSSSGTEAALFAISIRFNKSVRHPLVIDIHHSRRIHVCSAYSKAV